MVQGVGSLLYEKGIEVVDSAQFVSTKSSKVTLGQPAGAIGGAGAWQCALGRCARSTRLASATNALCRVVVGCVSSKVLAVLLLLLLLLACRTSDAVWVAVGVGLFFLVTVGVHASASCNFESRTLRLQRPASGCTLRPSPGCSSKGSCHGAVPFVP